MEIGLYEDWMKPQVAKLFNMQYGVDEKDFSELIGNFYELPFQKEKCIRIVAKEGNAIVGFQSFFYWPYIRNGKSFNSFQSGNSLVHPDHRGKGIFQKLLNYLDEHSGNLGIDFLVGFPVEQSKNSFLRNNWKNILNLRWYIKLINPFAFLFDISKLRENFGETSPDIKEIIATDIYRLTSSTEFRSWRNSYSTTKYFYHTYTESGSTVTFQLKSNKRNSWFNELIIGDIQTNSTVATIMKNAFKDLHRKARRSLAVTAITVAVSEKASGKLFQTLKELSYIRTKKEIYFIVKPFSTGKDIEEAERWLIYRSDIDTW